VVVEQDPGVEDPVAAPAGLLELCPPPVAIEVVDHDRALLDTAGSDVIVSRAGQQATRQAGHLSQR